MPDFSPHTLGLALLLRGGREVTNSALKIFFSCYLNKVRPRDSIEKGEVLEAHIMSTEIQQSPHPFLYERALLSVHLTLQDMC